MNVEKIKEIFSDEEFVKSMLELETVAEVQAALKEKGVELSEEEILSIRELLLKVESGEITQEQLEICQRLAEDGELSDEELEQVAGGFSTAFIVGVTIAGIAILVGAIATITTETIMRCTRRRW